LRAVRCVRPPGRSETARAVFRPTNQTAPPPSILQNHHHQPQATTWPRSTASALKCSRASSRAATASRRTRSAFLGEGGELLLRVYSFQPPQQNATLPPTHETKQNKTKPATPQPKRTLATFTARPTWPPPTRAARPRSRATPTA
jgi:type II secretory pathway pseudopilin PulG